ncbi:MAG: hypothetical protein JO369_04480 [Paucibacter sp.]|nr:hypothetical protein [Roseateles sp.]
MIGQLVADFFAGAFLANAVPHFVAGTMGRSFQTPFANPPGRGLSSPTVNVLWGFFNFVVGVLLAWRVSAVSLDAPVDAITCGAGALALGLFLARRFGAIYSPVEPKPEEPR